MLNRSDELKDRIEAKRLELSSRLAELRANARADAIDARDGIESRLKELELHLKDGWERVSDATRSKLNEWLGRDR